MSEPPEPKEPGGATFYQDGKHIYSYTEPSPSKPQRERKAPDLNPNIFVGPKLKIERAKCHIRDLEAAVIAFHDTKPYELILDNDPQTGEKVYRVHIKECIPVKFSAILGDIVHNLRSALDHLICDLIRANGLQPDTGSGFAIVKRKSIKDLKPGGIAKIQGIKPRAERLFLRLKPHEGGNSILWNLHTLDILDKHNGIVPVAAASFQVMVEAGLPFVFISPEGSLCLGGGPPGSKPLGMGSRGVPHNFKPVFPLEDNIEIHRSPGSLQENLEASISVAFDKGKVAEGQPVPETLKQYASFVERLLWIFEKHAI